MHVLIAVGRAGGQRGAQRRPALWRALEEELGAGSEQRLRMAAAATVRARLCELECDV